MTKEGEVLRSVAGWANRYRAEFGVNRRLLTVLENPFGALRWFFGHAFARAGAERIGYGAIAITALGAAVLQAGSFTALMARPDAPSLVWKAFTVACETANVGLNAERNKGVVEGLVALAREAPEHNIFLWAKGLLLSGRAEDAFIVLRGVKGIGDKVAAFILRDLADILGAEELTPPEDRVYFQPVDRWVRATAEIIWPDLHPRTPGWVIARRIVRRCVRHGVSSVAFNQGAWYLGAMVAKDRRKLAAILTSQKL